MPVEKKMSGLCQHMAMNPVGMHSTTGKHWYQMAGLNNLMHWNDFGTRQSLPCGAANMKHLCIVIE